MTQRGNFIPFTSTEIVSCEPMGGVFGGNQNAGFWYATFVDGSGGIIKELKDWVGNKTGRLYRAEILAAQEYLAALVGKVIDAPIRDCKFYGSNAHTVIMPYIQGETGLKLEQENLPDTPQTALLRLMDYLTANSDRRPKNWVVTPAGKIIGIDHALCNFRPRVPSALLLGQLRNGGITLESLLAMEVNLKGLEPEFIQLGMGNKFSTMMDNLDELIEAYRSADRAQKAASLVVKSLGHKVQKDTFTPPKGVQEAAQRALGWIAEGKQGDGFTNVGRKRASGLANGHSVSMDTIKRMKAYLDRHQPDQKAEGFEADEDGYPSVGRVAWDAWGGDAGYAWATSVVKSEGEDITHLAKTGTITPSQYDQFIARNGQW